MCLCVCVCVCVCVCGYRLSTQSSGSKEPIHGLKSSTISTLVESILVYFNFLLFINFSLVNFSFVNFSSVNFCLLNLRASTCLSARNALELRSRFSRSSPSIRICHFLLRNPTRYTHTQTHTHTHTCIQTHTHTHVWGRLIRT